MKHLLIVLLFIQIAWGATMQETAIKTLVEKHGNSQHDRIETGVRQVANLWRDSDGAEQDFVDFCEKNFITDPQTLDATFERFQRNLEIIYGHNHEINRDLSMPMELDMDPLLGVDYLFAEYDPFAHLQDDLFKTKIAFVALLNFEATTLEEKLKHGDSWTRETWAASRLAETFNTRVPAAISQELSRSYVQADDYIANYNILMHNLVDANNERLFPKGLKLISHWGLRDELKSQYAQADGLQRQQMIEAVMERIIRQEIPADVINKEGTTWNPLTNELYRDGEPVDFEREPDERYAKFLQIFHAEQKADPYYPDNPTQIDRRFNMAREIPAARYEEMMDSILKSPIGKQVADLIAKRLGRDLQPFDIWYDGFTSRAAFSEAELDSIVSTRYPTVAAFQNDLPAILQALSFDAETAAFLQSKITVDPSRGAGHATGAMRSEDNAHLRTRIPETGMNYKGFNIAIHELGHNVEQVFTLNKMDYYTLNGVPNTAFTEAFAFVFQSRDLDVLGLAGNDPEAEHLQALDTYWSVCEIGAVGLVDLRVWRWLYDNPDATPAELRTAVLGIAKDVWNEYYYPMTGVKDSILLAVYSHMIAYGLYLPDYSIGHIIMFQIEQYLKDKNLGREMERMCKIGRVTPDYWMRQAVGAPVSTAPLLQATEKAVKALQ